MAQIRNNWPGTTEDETLLHGPIVVSCLACRLLQEAVGESRIPVAMQWQAGLPTVSTRAGHARLRHTCKVTSRRLLIGKGGPDVILARANSNVPSIIHVTSLRSSLLCAGAKVAPHRWLRRVDCGSKLGCLICIAIVSRTRGCPCISYMIVNGAKRRAWHPVAGWASANTASLLRRRVFSIIPGVVKDVCLLPCRAWRCRVGPRSGKALT